MAVSDKTSGTTSVTNSATTLATITDAGEYEIVIDLSNIAAEDVFEFWAEVKTLTGTSSATTVWRVGFADVQSNKSPPFPTIRSRWSVAFKGIRISGSNRNFDWAVREVTTSASAADTLVATTVASVTSTTVFTLTDGSSANSSYADCIAVLEDASIAGVKAVATITGYVGATKTVTIAAAPPFTVAIGDTVTIMAVLQQLSSVTSVTSTVTANVVQISGDTTAADNLEKMLDGTGGVDLTCDIAGQLIGDVEGKVLGTGASAIGGVGASVNVAQISDDTTAADNAEKFFDGTGYGPLLVRTTVTGLSSQTVFNLSAGSSDDNAYNGATIVIEDASTAAQKCVGTINDYVGATKTVTLLADPGVFTIANSDIVTIIAAGVTNVTRWNGLPVAQEDVGGTAYPHVSTKLLAAEQISDEAAANFEGFFGNAATPSTVVIDDIADVSTFDPTTTGVNVNKIDGSTTAAAIQKAFNESIPQGNVSGTPAAGSFQSDTSALSSTDNEYRGMCLHFISGSLKGENRFVSGYTGSSKTFTFTGLTTKPDAPFPSAPSAGDDFILLGRGSKS